MQEGRASFQEHPPFLKEATRVLCEGGRLGIADMTFPKGTEAFFNEIERVRDSSHVKALTADEWMEILKAEGFAISKVETISYYTTFEQWLYPVPTGGDEESRIRDERKALDPTAWEMLAARGDRQHLDGFTRYHVIIIAAK